MNSLKRYNQFKINESMTDKIEQFVKEISAEFLNSLNPVLEFAQDVNDILQGFEDDGLDYEFDTLGIPSDYEGVDSKFLLLNIDFQENKVLFNEDEIFWDFSLKELEYFMFDIENKDIIFRITFLNTGREWGSELESFESRIWSINQKTTHQWTGIDRVNIKFKISDLK